MLFDQETELRQLIDEIGKKFPYMDEVRSMPFFSLTA
jgi:hypothetical protein